MESQHGYGNAMPLAHSAQALGAHGRGDGGHFVIAIAKTLPQRLCLPSAVQSERQESGIRGEDELIDPAYERRFHDATDDFPE